MANQQLDEALLLQSQIAQLKHPDNRVLEAVTHFFQRPHPILGGKAKEFLNNKNDLIAIKSPGEVDFLSRWLRQHWVYDVGLSLYVVELSLTVSKKETARDNFNQFGRFNEASINMTVNVITIILAAVFLFGSIIGFYFVRGAVVKLVMIAVFTALFAASLGLITNARRAEIFGATAAYVLIFETQSIFIQLTNCRAGTLPFSLSS